MRRQQHTARSGVRAARQLLCSARGCDESNARPTAARAPLGNDILRRPDAMKAMDFLKDLDDIPVARCLATQLFQKQHTRCSQLRISHTQTIVRP